MSDSELDQDLAGRGKSRADFDAHLNRMVAEWLEARGEPPNPADPTEAIEAITAELREALEPVAVEPALPVQGAGSRSTDPLPGH